jgi:tetratricopeptide (TPR) repeat protein
VAYGNAAESEALAGRKARMTTTPTIRRGALLLIAILAAAPAAGADLPELIRKVQPSIVTVLALDARGEPVQLGTGFFVDRKGHLITNRHVLEGSVRVEVKTADGDVYPVTEVVAEDASADLIKVRVELPKDAFRPLKLTRSLPAAGERIVVIGSPYGLEKSVSDGIVSNVRDIDELGKVIQITAPISPGSSGSPVMNMKGDVVGIATVQLAEGQNLNFAVPGLRLIALTPKTPVAVSRWSADLFADAGDALAREERWKEAAMAYAHAVEADATFADGYVGLGRALDQLGHQTEAFTAYREAIRRKPDSAAAHLGIAQAYRRVEQWGDATSSIEEALRLDPGSGDAVAEHGRILLGKGDKGGALDQYRRLQQLDSDAANALLNEIYAVPAAEERDAGAEVAEEAPAAAGREDAAEAGGVARGVHQAAEPGDSDEQVREGEALEDEDESEIGDAETPPPAPEG